MTIIVKTCRTCGFSDCPSLDDGGGCPRWPGTGGQADPHGLAFLAYTQLLDALTESKGEYEERFTAFIAACTAAHIAAETGDQFAELRAEMDTRWAACTAQAAMTRAITAEITARIGRRDYA